MDKHLGGLAKAERGKSKRVCVGGEADTRVGVVGSNAADVDNVAPVPFPHSRRKLASQDGDCGHCNATEGSMSGH